MSEWAEVLLTHSFSSHEPPCKFFLCCYQKICKQKFALSGIAKSTWLISSCIDPLSNCICSSSMLWLSWKGSNSLFQFLRILQMSSALAVLKRIKLSYSVSAHFKIDQSYLKIWDRNPKDHRVAASTDSFGHCEPAESAIVIAIVLMISFVDNLWLWLFDTCF